MYNIMSSYEAFCTVGFGNYIQSSPNMGTVCDSNISAISND